MTNLEKQELRKLAKDMRPFHYIRQRVNCSDATIRRYMRVFQTPKEQLND